MGGYGRIGVYRVNITSKLENKGTFAFSLFILSKPLCLNISGDLPFTISLSQEWKAKQFYNIINDEKRYQENVIMFTKSCFQEFSNSYKIPLREDIKIHNCWLQPKCCSIQQLCVVFLCKSAATGC